MDNDFNYTTASKDELLSFAKALGRDLNGRDKLESLRSQVQALLAQTDTPKTAAADAAAETKKTRKRTVVSAASTPEYHYCLNLKNGRILLASPGMRRLVSLGELVPCDAKGQRL